MAQIIGLPKLSPTMEEGVLVRWVKKEGDRVQPGDLVAEVETDKANMDFNLEDEGVLLKLLVQEGQTVKLGAPVAILGEEGEDITSLVQNAGGSPAPATDAAKGAAAKPAKAEADAPAAKPAAKAAKPAAKADAKAEAKAEAKPDAKAEAKGDGKTRSRPESEPEAAPRTDGKPAAKSARSDGAGADAPSNGEASPTQKAASATAPRSGGPLLASPLAKSLAIELGVDLRQVTGTGPGGRIVERDVQGAADGGAQHAADEPEVELAVTTETRRRPAAHDAGAEPIDVGEQGADDGGDVDDDETQPSGTALAVISPGPIARQDPSDEYVDKPLTATRKTIAQRLTQAKRDIPHFRLTATVDAGPMMDFRERLNHLLGDRGKVSVNDLLIKGAALALRRVPECNVAFAGDALRYFTRVHMGVAVALESGLVTPIVRNADLKGIGVISAEVRDLVDRAKRRQLKVHDIQGATFTISNLGMFGIDHFDAIINPPAACILAVGRIQKLAVVEEAEGAARPPRGRDRTAGHRITVGERMTLTLSCDHRAVDGALGARYLDELRDLLERPESLAL